MRSRLPERFVVPAFPAIGGGILLVCMLASGCTGTIAGIPGGTGGEDPGLAGTSWVLTGGLLRPADGTPAITLTFDDKGNTGGSGGCNRYRAEYTRQDPGLALGPVMSTLMWCDAPGVSAREQEYFVLLGLVRGYRVTGGSLRLLDGNGTPVLVFTNAVQDGPRPLAGTRWALDSMTGGPGTVSPLIAGTTIDAVFSGDGNLTGSAGCNDYFASYTKAGSSLSVSAIGSTKMNCHIPQGIMIQESGYLALLESVREYRIDGDRLEFADANGSQLLSFRAAT